MLLKDNSARALKGFIQSRLIGSKKLYIIVAAIVFGNVIISSFIGFLVAKLGSKSSTNGGALSSGFAMVAMVMFMSAIIMAVGKGMKASFVFPIDRKTYVMGNFIIFFINTIGLLLVSSVAFLLEASVFKILMNFSDNIIYINYASIETYFVGFWISLCYIFFITVFIHFAFMLYARFELPAVIISSLVTLLLFIFAFGRNILYHVLTFFIFEQSILLLSIKLIVLAVVFQGMTWLNMRKMEVKV